MITDAGIRVRTSIKTLLLCDLVDSTKLVDRCGDERASEIFRAHDAAARRILHATDGFEVDKSDGFLLLFDRPIEAVRFAMAYHGALVELSEDFGVPLAARVGVHLGEVVTRENTDGDTARGAKRLEVEGLAKPIAARVMSLAEARQTLLTQAAFEVARRSAVGGDLESDLVRWRAHGSYQLKGISDPVDVFEVGLVGLSPLIAPPGNPKARRLTGPERPGVLVLPFVNLTGSAENDFISDGLAEELITTLTHLEAIRVVSRASAMQLKGTELGPLELGRRMEVRLILEGSVKRAGDRLRISTRLVDAARDDTLWSHRHDGSMEDLFDIEESIARDVVEALQVQLTSGENRQLSTRRIPDARAYEYYLRAKQLVYAFRADALDQAQDYLKKGLEILGDNPQLTAAIGFVHWQYFNIGASSDTSHLDRARVCANSLLEADPHSPDGHRLLGMVEILAKGDSADVIRHLRHALATDPDNTDALFWLSLMYGFVGRPSSAFPLIERLLRRDPLSALHQMLPGYLCMLDGDFEQARESFARAHGMEPQNPMITLSYGQLLALLGEREEAGKRFQLVAADAAGTFFGAIGAIFWYALEGDRESVVEHLVPEIRDGAASDLQYSWILAQCLALTGETERAIGWIENSIAQGCFNYPLFAERDPLLEPLRTHPRYRALMDDLRERWERFDI